MCPIFYALFIYTGRIGEPSRKGRLVDSTEANMAFAASGGRLLPGKHLSLGMAVKSMTGSKTLTNFLNRFGHCVSNEKVRQIDMALESSINEKDNLVPKAIRKDQNLPVAIAWDNFDINMETLSGADTIHHTYGICYQNESNEVLSPSGTVDVEEAVATETGQGYVAMDDSVTPYFKKPSMKCFPFENICLTITSSVEHYRIVDYVWILQFNYLQQKPMWTGWNMMKCAEVDSAKQTVSEADTFVTKQD